MLRRFFNIIVAVLTLGLVRLEKSTASARRTAIIDQKVRQVADAKKSLGSLGGAARETTREVSRLEGELQTVSARKAHFMGIVKSTAKGSPESTDAMEKARACHHEINTLTEDLNTARSELQTITTQYEQAKALVQNAEGAVKDAKKQGKRMERQRTSARRRKDLVETTSSLRGLNGMDELAEIDELLMGEIDQLDGAAMVAADFAADALADQQLDVQIARSQADSDFEAELAAMEDEDVIDVQATPEREALPERTTAPAFEIPTPAAPPTPEPEPVRVRSGGEDFGSSDFGSSDSGSSDFGGGSDD